MTDAAVEMMFSNSGNIQLGADVGVALGPLGRALEADIGAAPGSVAPIYTYSLSKGLYAGVSLDGKVIVTRERVNERFYGRTVSGMEILQGHVPTPPAARPLYDALQRVHVYATGNIPTRRSMGPPNPMMAPPSAMPPMPPQHQIYPKAPQMEYGELPEPIPEFTIGDVPPPTTPTNVGSVMPPAANDQHSYAGMSDITSDPGY